MKDSCNYTLILITVDFVSGQIVAGARVFLKTLPFYCKKNILIYLLPHVPVQANVKRFRSTALTFTVQIFVKWVLNLTVIALPIVWGMNYLTWGWCI